MRRQHGGIAGPWAVPEPPLPGPLEDPQQVFLAGSSKFFRAIGFTPAGDVEPELVASYVQRAMARLEYFRENWARPGSGNTDRAADLSARWRQGTARPACR